MIELKRAYEPYSSEDGYRILVDRLWPRGISKEKAHIDLWLKDVAPSTELRKWFGHDPEKWEEFEKRYKKEIGEKEEFIRSIKTLEQKHKKVTLIYGAKDTLHNEAVVLKKLLELK